MTRFKLVNNELVPLTTEEEALRDVEEAAWAASEVERQKIEHNRPILEQIKELDIKRIRPLVEGDTEVLESLNQQIIALRSRLK